jgi:Outer membrane protein beta-barrel domain
MPAFLLVCVLAAGAQQSADSQSPAVLTPGDRVVIKDERQTIRGILANLTPDEVTLEPDPMPIRIPLSTVRQIDRVGDPLFNGAAIGGGIGAAAALAAMARACSNSGCSDTSSSLDPRITLLGALGGAALGAIIDAVMERPKTVYTAGSGQMPAFRASSVAAGGAPQVVFVRAGWASLADDEGRLGDGGSVGAGVIVRVWRNIGVQVAYDRHAHRRDITSGPPGSTATGGFSGTEQLLTVKTLFFARDGHAVRPYGGIGVGYLRSKRMSEFPTFVLPPGSFFPVPGAPEIFEYQTRGAGMGFSAGAVAQISNRFSVLGDVSLDFANPNALSSARLTAGAGYRF